MRSRPRARRARCAALALLASGLLALPSTGRAQGAADPGFGLVLLVSIFELLIPDLRYEWGPGTDDAHTTLAWPLSVSAQPVLFGRHLGIGLDGRVELQLRPADGYRDRRGVRGVLAARVPVFLRFGGFGGTRMDFDDLSPGLYGEAGLVGGNAGEGTLLGGGVFFGNDMMALALGYRALDLDDIGRRHSIGLDLHFSFPLGRILCQGRTGPVCN